MNKEVMRIFRCDKILAKHLETIKKWSIEASDYILNCEDDNINTNILIDELDYIPARINEIDKIILEIVTEYETIIHELKTEQKYI